MEPRREATEEITKVVQRLGKLEGTGVPSGKLYHWNERKGCWQEDPPVGGEGIAGRATDEEVHALVVRLGKLEATGRTTGQLYRWNDQQACWEKKT
jgi:hypothetical protein